MIFSIIFQNFLYFSIRSKFNNFSKILKVKNFSKISLKTFAKISHCIASKAAGGTNLLHCWVTDSILLEAAESLITKRLL